MAHSHITSPVPPRALVAGQSPESVIFCEAVSLFRKAADQGFAPAHYNLGVMHYNGHGVLKNNVLAHMWFDLAVSRSTASQQEWRDNAKRARDKIAHTMSPAQVAEAQLLAREWKPKKER
jgi:TPR repeat protein